MAGRLKRARPTSWRRLVCLFASLLATSAGCAEGIVGMEETTTPLATLRVELAPGTDVSDLAHPRVGLIWAGQVIAEPTCWLAALGLGGAAQQAAAAGCRDPLGFYPKDAGVSVPLGDDGTAEIPLYALPSADWMIGDLTARVAYATVVLYDDGQDDETLGIRFPWWGRGRAYLPVDQRGELDGGGGPGGGPDGGGDGGGGGPGGGPGEFGDEGARDVIHAASFVSMTRADLRLAFREGDFDAASAFYPRPGCAAPAKGYSLLGADGFGVAEAVLAFGKGELPTTTGCTASGLDAGVVVLAREATETLRGIGCVRGNTVGSNGAARYREPPETAPWMPYAKTACVPLGSAGQGILGAAGLGAGGTGSGGGGGSGGGSGGSGGGGGGSGDGPSAEELLVPYPTESCPALRHYILRGCRNDPSCEVPEWDLTDHPPAWWPCDGHVPEEDGAP